jgi:uncharacterized lipoprotein NlpE involved in copper resistance
MKADLKEELGVITRDFVFVGGQMFNGNPVKGQPYSAEAVNETTQTLADGNKIVTRSSTMIYRDSEGRERREETIRKLGALGTSGTPAKVVFISDPVAGVSFSLHSEDHTAEKMPAPMAKARTFTTDAVTTQSYAFTVGTSRGVSPPEPPAHVFFEAREKGSHGEAAGKVEQLGMQTIEGVPAEGTRTTTTIPAGQIGNERDINIVSERWVSKDLGVLVMSTRSDPRTGVTDYKLTNVNRSEPAHTLFEIPADYTVSEAGAARPGARIVKDEQ